MTEKELRRLRGSVLIQMALEQDEEAEQLREQLNDLRRKLADLSIEKEQIGSIADAGTKVSDIFSGAQTQADTYVEEVRAATAGKSEFFRTQNEQQEARLARKEKEVQAHLFAQETHSNALRMVQEEEAGDRLRLQEEEVMMLLSQKEKEQEERLAKKEKDTVARLSRLEEETRDRCVQMEKDSQVRSRKYLEDIRRQMKGYAEEKKNGRLSGTSLSGETASCSENAAAVPFVVTGR